MVGSDAHIHPAQMEPAHRGTIASYGGSARTCASFHAQVK
jgi:hypothetical protein